MESQELHAEAVHAYLELIALNMGSWRREVADWLHSDDSGPALRTLLAAVPCSSTVH